MILARAKVLPAQLTFVSHRPQATNLKSQNSSLRYHVTHHKSFSQVVCHESQVSGATLSAMSSMPRVVRMTLAPALSILAILSLVTSFSLHPQHKDNTIAHRKTHYVRWSLCTLEYH